MEAQTLFSMDWSEPYRMSHSSCAHQPARISIFHVSVTISYFTYQIPKEMYSLKVPLRVVIESTSWVGRSAGSVSIFETFTVLAGKVIDDTTGVAATNKGFCSCQAIRE
jgi:hypothetical protein